MKSTHKTRLLEYLVKYKTITSLEAIRDLGNTRLSASIFSLKKDGYIIHTSNVDVPTRWVKKDGTKKTTSVAKYELTGSKLINF
jgi:hypothetical protein